MKVLNKNKKQFDSSFLPPGRILYIVTYFGVFLIITATILSCKDRGFSNVAIDDKIEILMTDYVEAWSNGDVTKIVKEIYEAPITIRYKDSLVILGNEERIRNFLFKTFAELESKNYGYSVINNWEAKSLEKNIFSFKMNYTRFLKDSTIMGNKERETSYILKKNKKGDYRIKALIPKTPID